MSIFNLKYIICGLVLCFMYVNYTFINLYACVAGPEYLIYSDPSIIDKEFYDSLEKLTGKIQDLAYNLSNYRKHELILKYINEAMEIWFSIYTKYALSPPPAYKNKPGFKKELERITQLFKKHREQIKQHKYEKAYQELKNTVALINKLLTPDFVFKKIKKVPASIVVEEAVHSLAKAFAERINSIKLKLKNFPLIVLEFKACQSFGKALKIDLLKQFRTEARLKIFPTDRLKKLVNKSSIGFADLILEPAIGKKIAEFSGTNFALYIDVSDAVTELIKYVDDRNKNEIIEKDEFTTKLIAKLKIVNLSNLKVIYIDEIRGYAKKALLFTRKEGKRVPLARGSYNSGSGKKLFEWLMGK